MARDAPRRKIGAGHAAGMARQGLRELRQALYPESNVAQQTDYGIWGVATPGEVAESRRSDVRDKDDEGGRQDPPQPELPGRDGIDLE
jgi:hypothetical protein